MRSDGRHPGGAGGAAAPGRWYALLILTGIMIAHQIDRTVISVVMEPIKHEFGLDDGAMGLLSGLAHSVALALFILPLGWLADRSNRVRFIALLVLIWSGFTALGALAQNYAALLLMRFGVGAAEAGGPPAAVSLLSDLFPPRERPLALGLYYTHVAIGTGLVFLLGGYIAHVLGWRAAFLVAGLPGILFALLLLTTVAEPVRGTTSERNAPSIAQAVRELGRNRALLLLIMAGTIATIAQISVWTWLASFLIREHGFSLIEVGLIGAVALGCAKATGSAVSGPLAQRLGGRHSAGLWRYPALVQFLSVPATWLMVEAGSGTIAIAAAILLGLLLGGWPAPVTALVIESVPRRLQASSVSLYQLSTNLLGASTGPVLTGLISDAYGGTASLGAAIGTVICVNLASAAVLYAASQALRRNPAIGDIADPHGRG